MIKVSFTHMFTICVCSLEKAEKRFLLNTCTLYFKIQTLVTKSHKSTIWTKTCNFIVKISYCRVLMPFSVDFENCSFSKRQTWRCFYDKLFYFPRSRLPLLFFHSPNKYTFLMVLVSSLSYWEWLWWRMVGGMLRLLRSSQYFSPKFSVLCSKWELSL